MGKQFCEVCGEELKDYEIRICDNCVNDYAECKNCGSIHKKNDMYTTNSGDIICEDCLNNGDYFVCDDCGDIFESSDMNDVYDSSGYVSSSVCCSCANNYDICIDCEEFFESDAIRFVDGIGYVCDSCLENGYYGTCDSCGEWFREDDLEYHEHLDGYYCSDCYPNDEFISNYHSHDNDLEFFGDNKNNNVPYLGVELEIDKGRDNNECAKYSLSCFPNNFIYFEYDGSLNSGFENITQPATLDYHYGEKNNYEKMFKNAIEMGYRSHDTNTCGFHVHFNRNFYDDNEELYVTRLLYLVEKFWDELVKFSRRDIDSLNRWAKKYDDTPENIVNEWKRDSWKLDRYQAVNLTNDNTIEFRMFRGTLKLNTFIATLQLCNTMIMTAKNIKSIEDIQSMKWEDLLCYDEVKKYWEEVKNR